MGIAIRAEHLSKMYRLGVINHGYFYKDIQSWLARKFHRPDPHTQIGKDHFASQGDHFWALKDICIDIEEGDRVGIIGKNGAGKSTFLKIISRITIPTEGALKVRGRVKSLLEVGTGFHQELTGRENIFLNGAILGMKRKNIADKFEEILEFSEISEFVDTPVKRYSSGMYVRLAFAVAVSFDCDILLADEVLAVGDAAFQKKCMAKMSDISTKEGKTVVFVSHNMGAVETLCRHVIQLDKGRLVGGILDAHEAAVKYLGHSEQESPPDWTNTKNTYQNPYFTPLRLFIEGSENNVAELPLKNDAAIKIRIEGSILESTNDLLIGYSLHDASGLLLFLSFNTDQNISQRSCIDKGRINFTCQVPAHLLNEGEYSIRLAVKIHGKDWILDPNADTPRIKLVIDGGLSQSPYWTKSRPGILAPVLEWKSVRD